MPSWRDLVSEQWRKRVARTLEGKRMPLRRKRSREETASEREELEKKGFVMQSLENLKAGIEGDGIGIAEKNHVSVKCVTVT